MKIIGAFLLVISLPAFAQTARFAFATSPVAEDFAGDSPAAFDVDNQIHVRVFFDGTVAAALEKSAPGTKCSAPRELKWQVRPAGGEWVSLTTETLSAKRFESETSETLMDSRGEKPVPLYTAKPSDPSTIQYAWLHELIAQLPDGEQPVEFRASMQCFGADNALFELGTGQTTLRVKAAKVAAMAKASAVAPPASMSAGDLKAMKTASSPLVPEGYTLDTVQADVWEVHADKLKRVTHRSSHGRFYLHKTDDKKFCASVPAMFRQNAKTNTTFDTETKVDVAREAPRRIICGQTTR